MKAVHRILDPAQIDAAAANRCALAVMTKAPRPGFVKTRLVPPLTHEQAAQLNIRFLRDTAAAISEACGAGARGVGVYSPAGAESEYDGVLPNDFQLLVQRGDGFGERLRNAAADLFHIGFSSVCLINSDSPTVSSDVYRVAVDLLGKKGDRVVLGPSGDGGYYLIGLKKVHQRLFEEIEWSTDCVLEQTKERANQLGLEIQLLPVFHDVDDPAGLNRLCHDLLDEKQAGAETIASHTCEFLKTLFGRRGTGAMSSESLRRS
jgi:rSAM/selenodomain-associated transferase 1